MTLIRITKQFRFEAAHALYGYDGPCRTIHGHSYELSVTVTGSPQSDPSSAKIGMVMDFGELKKRIKTLIIDRFDHALLLHEAERPGMAGDTAGPFCNVVFLPYQPTSENFLIDFAGRIREILPEGVSLHSMRLRETDSSYAEWFAADN